MCEVSMKNHSWATSHTTQHIQRQDVCGSFPYAQYLAEEDKVSFKIAQKTYNTVDFYVLTSPVHREVSQATRYPRCSPVHRSFPNPPTPQPSPATKQNKDLKGCTKTARGEYFICTRPHLLPSIQFDHRSEKTKQVRIKLGRHAAFLSSQQTAHIHQQQERSTSLHLSTSAASEDEAWWETLQRVCVVCSAPASSPPS